MALVLTTTYNISRITTFIQWRRNLDCLVVRRKFRLEDATSKVKSLPRLDGHCRSDSFALGGLLRGFPLGQQFRWPVASCCECKCWANVLFKQSRHIQTLPEKQMKRYATGAVNLSCSYSYFGCLTCWLFRNQPPGAADQLHRKHEATPYVSGFRWSAARVAGHWSTDQATVTFGRSLWSFRLTWRPAGLCAVRFPPNHGIEVWHRPCSLPSRPAATTCHVVNPSTRHKPQGDFETLLAKGAKGVGWDGLRYMARGCQGSVAQDGIVLYPFVRWSKLNTEFNRISSSGLWMVVQLWDIQ